MLGKTHVVCLFLWGKMQVFFFFPFAICTYCIVACLGYNMDLNAHCTTQLVADLPSIFRQLKRPIYGSFAQVLSLSLSPLNLRIVKCKTLDTSINFQQSIKYLGPCHSTGNFHELVALIGRAALPLTTQAAFWGEAWWRVQEFRQSELLGDSHRKPMKSGGGHPLAHRDRPLPLSPALSRLIFVPSRRQWWWTSCRSCGGSTVAGVKWLHGSRSFPSLHQEHACLSCGKALSRIYINVVPNHE